MGILPAFVASLRYNAIAKGSLWTEPNATPTALKTLRRWCFLHRKLKIYSEIWLNYVFPYPVSGFPTWAGILVGNSVAVLYTVLVSFVHVPINLSVAYQEILLEETTIPRGTPTLYFSEKYHDFFSFNFGNPSLVSLPFTLPYFEMLDSGVDYFYFQGGIREVIWADVFQAVVLLTGLLAIIIKVGFLLT